MTPRSRDLAAVCLAASLTAPREALAEDEPSATPREQLARLDREVLEQRMSFLSDRVSTEYQHGVWWWGGFLGFYTMGAVFQGWRASAATEKADQGALGVSTVKALFGMGRLISIPWGGYRDFNPPSAETLTTDELADQVHIGEQTMYDNAEQQASGRAWYAHVGNISINALGAVIVATAFDDPQQGLIDAGIGIAVGEAFILTSPWEADDDVEEYETRFESGSADAASLRRRRANRQPIEVRVAPYGAGMMVQGRF